MIEKTKFFRRIHSPFKKYERIPLPAREITLRVKREMKRSNHARF